LLHGHLEQEHVLEPWLTGLDGDHLVTEMCEVRRGSPDTATNLEDSPCPAELG
jgi:hypothetical protein